MSDMENCAVLDIGSRTVKMGLANNFITDDEPRAAVSSAVQVVHDGSPGPILNPVCRGRVTNFDHLERILYHAIYDLIGWEMGAEGSVVVAEPLFTSKSDREQLTQIMFEVFNATGLFIQDQPVLSLFAVGKLVGCVIDIGHDKIDIATVADGQTNLASARRLDCGGRVLTGYLQQLLKDRGIDVSDLLVVERLKEGIARAADSPADFPETRGLDRQPDTFKLPDGQEITVTTEGAHIAEALFQPSMLSIDGPGIAEAAALCIYQQAEIPVRKSMFENLMLCGGGSAIVNLQNRFLREIKLFTSLGATPSLAGTPEYMPPKTCKLAPWIGGAILAKVLLQQNHFMTKADYEEAGPYAIHKKCS